MLVSFDNDVHCFVSFTTECMMNKKFFCLPILTGLILSLMLFSGKGASAQTGSATLHGQVTDPTGAVIPQAAVTVTSSVGKTVATTKSNAIGHYSIPGLASGTYTITASSPGFAPYTSSITLAPGQSRNLQIAMAIQVQQQHVTVNAEEESVNTSLQNNTSAIVIKGKELAALSDDPDELQDELEALAGPAAGPNGGQIYIDGFTGGQMPPKSAISRIVINQDPFSAEYDTLGYGRIEIFTKPGSGHIHGDFHTRGYTSALNSRNPVLQVPEPSYYSYDFGGSIGGPIAKNVSYFISGFTRRTENVSVIDAIDPSSVTPSNPSGTLLSTTYPNPSFRLNLHPRIDIQLGSANTLTLQYGLWHGSEQNDDVGPLALPEQGDNESHTANMFLASDALVLNSNLVDNIRFRYIRNDSEQTPLSTLPSVTVQGSFSTGGSNQQTTRDDQGVYEFQDYLTASEGNHSINFGTRLRLFRDKNFSSSGTNGAYIFNSLTNYLNRKPQTYQVTVVNNNIARVNMFDAALFYQDDWKLSPRFTLGYGLRWESQNYISDKSDWGPRLEFAWALDGGNGRKAKTVLRAGYGWFYDRFTVPHSWGGTPFLIQAIHQNGINQKAFIETDPPFEVNGKGQPARPQLGSAVAGAPTIYNLDPRFHAALNMEAAVGIDRQIAKRITSNVTYIYTRGVHQFLTNNITAPSFATASEGIYPDQPLPAPKENIYQFQSGGVYRQNEIIGSVRANYGFLSLMSYYAYNSALGDTTGFDYVPSVAQDPGLDYGRVPFDVHNRFLFLGNFMGPWATSFTPFFFYNSGHPYNITAGSDLTRNNTFNGRPTYASNCSAPGVVRTKFGCLNTEPFGTGERMIPFGLGTGPSNESLNFRISKVVGVGPKVKLGEGAGSSGGHYHSHGLSGGFSGGRGGTGRLNAEVPRKYSIDFSVFVTNALNSQNLGTPNGSLSPHLVAGSLEPQPFFGKSQSLAGGFFSRSGGNRSVYLEARFSF